MKHFLIALFAASAVIATPVTAAPHPGAASTGKPTSENPVVLAALKMRLPKTTVDHIDCSKIAGLCEVTAGKTLFYVDAHARYMGAIHRTGTDIR